jgi:hypothetical protein
MLRQVCELIWDQVQDDVWVAVARHLTEGLLDLAIRILTGGPLD